MLLKSLYPIEFTQGDSPTLLFTATDDQNAPFVLTGAVLTTQIEGLNNVGPLILPNSQHIIDPDQVNNPGKFTLALSVPNTQACGLGAYKEVITTAVIGATTITFRGLGILTVYPPVPTQ